MQIRKCQWLARPEKAKIVSSSTIEFASENEHALLHTFSEEGTLTLSWKADSSVSVSLVYINTETEGIEFQSENGALLKHQVMAGIDTRECYKTAFPSTFSVTKEGDALTFFADGTPLSVFHRENVKAAVSLGLAARGKGQCSFSFVFRGKAD
jgi:hypothetical protein